MSVISLQCYEKPFSDFCNVLKGNHTEDIEDDKSAIGKRLIGQTAMQKP